MAIDFSNADAFKGVVASSASLPPSGIPPIGTPIPQVDPAIEAKARLQSAAAKAQADLDAFHVANPGLKDSPVAAPASAPAIPPLPVHNKTPKAHGVAQPAPPQVDPTTGLQNAQARVDLADETLSKATAATGDVEADNAARESEARGKQARDLDVQSRLNALDRSDADKHISNLRDAAAKKKITGIFDGPGGTFKLIATAVGQILGSLSYDSNHQNQTIGIIDKAIHNHFEQEQAEKADLWKDVANAIDQKQMLSRDQLQEMGDFRARQALDLESVIAEGKRQASLSKNKEGIAAIEAHNSRLQFEAEKAIEQAKQFYVTAAEKHRLDSSEINRNNAQAEHARAAASTEKSTAGQLKLDKFNESFFKTDVTEAHGSNRSPGPVTLRDKARAIAKDLEDSLATRDPQVIKAAMASAREQTSNILTGSVATKLSTHFVTDLQSSIDKAEANISSLIGSPTEAKHFVKGVQTLVGGIEKQQTERIEAQRSRTIAKAKSTNAWKNPEIRSSMEQRINSIYGEPEAAKAQIPAGYTNTGRTSGGKPVYLSPDGKTKVVF